MQNSERSRKTFYTGQNGIISGYCNFYDCKYNKAFVFKEDYEVIRNMIYGKIPEFEEILEFLQKLQEEVHELKKL